MTYLSISLEVGIVKYFEFNNMANNMIGTTAAWYC